MCFIADRLLSALVIRRGFAECFFRAQLRVWEAVLFSQTVFGRQRKRTACCAVGLNAFAPCEVTFVGNDESRFQCGSSRQGGE